MTQEEQKQFIEKVCKWVELSIYDYMDDCGAKSFKLDEMLNDFRKEIIDFDVD